MFVAEISWQISTSMVVGDSDEISYELAEELDQISYEFLAYLRKNGQIINYDYPIARSGDRLRTFVMILELDSLDLKYENKRS